MPQYLSQRQIHFLMGSIIISTNFELHNHTQVIMEQFLKKKKNTRTESSPKKKGI